MSHPLQTHSMFHPCIQQHMDFLCFLTFLSHARRLIFGTEILMRANIKALNDCVLVISTPHTHTHTFNGPLSGTTQVSRYHKGKTNLDFTRARDSERQWHQLGHMQVCTSLQTDNHASTPPLSFFYRPDALPAAQPTNCSTEGT